MRLLERHRARREQRLPTISCFVGPLDQARALFGGVSLRGDQIEVELAEALAQSRPLWRDAIALTGRTPEELRAKTPYERDVLYRAVDLPHGAQELIEAWCSDRSPAPIDLRTLEGLVPASAWPRALIARPSAGALTELARIVEDHPAIEVAVVMDAEEIDRAPPRIAAMLRAGLIHLLEEASARAKVEVLEATDGDRAKSAAERFLHQVLETAADLRGLFEPNQRMDFDFGGKPAEIDLCCAELRIALEIDGWFHFQDADAYRRDRRKDLMLQQEGFLVLRFLAEDVVVRLEEVLGTIRQALQLRRNA